MSVNIVSRDQLISLFKVPFVPQKVAFDPNCEFFEEGNRFYRSVQKQLIVEDDIGDETASTFACTEPNCKMSFNSMQSCEVHHACAHRYVCVECKRVFPSQPTLDLHIQDTHNPHDLTEADCKNVSYSCFIPLCMRQFLSREERNEHLISDHKYPPNFKFGVLHGTKNLEPEKMDTSGPSEDAPASGAKYKPKIPHNICFGRGSSKAFKRKDVALSRVSNRASRPNQESEMESSICMTELQDVLP